MIELAVDNTNVASIDVWNTAEVVATLRRVADEIESGAVGEVGSVIFVLDHAESGPEFYGCGEVRGTALTIGLVEIAKARLIAQSDE